MFTSLSPALLETAKANRVSPIDAGAIHRIVRMTDDTTIAKRYLSLPGSWHTLSTNQRMAIHLGLLGAAVLFVYYRTFNWLLQVWWTQDAYSHGFLIPLIASYLVWVKRDHLAQLPQRPNLAKGGLLLFVSTIMLLAGRAGGSVLLEAISLLILLPGIVLFIWGSGHLRALMLPLGYLQFMIPWTGHILRAGCLGHSNFCRHALPLSSCRQWGISVFREATVSSVPSRDNRGRPKTAAVSASFIRFSLFPSPSFTSRNAHGGGRRVSSRVA